ELKRAKAKLQASIEASPAAIIISTAPDGKLEMANKAALRLSAGNADGPDARSGADPGNPGQLGWHFLRPDGSACRAEEEPLSRALRGETVRNEIRGIIKPDGERSWVLANAAPVRSDEGDVLAAVAVLPDITEVREARKKIRDLARFPEENPFPVMRVGADRGFIYSNPGSGDVLSYLTTEKGRMVRKACDATVRQALDRDEVMEKEMEVDGKWYVFVFAPFVGEGYVNVYGYDITERKMAEKELRAYRDQLEDLVSLRTRKLEEANRELESFSYSVSHDLRAPLRAINGFSEMLREDFRDKLGNEGARKLDVIKKNTLSMSSQIESLLKYSRLGRSALSPENIDMADMFRKVLDEQLPEGGGRKTDIVIRDMPEARVDRVMIRQVLSNLISNALKYTDKENSPRIEAGGYTQDGNNVYYVKDNGVGFDMRYADKLFTVFQRLHSGKEYEGVGVGLSLVHRAVHKHGGKVWAESEPGKGATFYFSLSAKGPGSREEEGV
ncbi:MAG: PAS domain S-box protein, partial [Candidatus Omnitrophica bacterium]|nr:PAS domain S-box protein [Candidatus Omnitrophota bacterium]